MNLSFVRLHHLLLIHVWLSGKHAGKMAKLRFDQVIGLDDGRNCAVDFKDESFHVFLGYIFSKTKQNVIHL